MSLTRQEVEKIAHLARLSISEQEMPVYVTSLSSIVAYVDELSKADVGTVAPMAHPLVEFNFIGHDLDLKRFMVGFRRCIDILAHDAVRAMTRLSFPVKFNDRLRRLNRITPVNRIKSAAIAALIDAVPPLAAPIFGTLADRRVDLAALAADDEALADHIRENVAGTFHPVGTCRMGAASDRDAVTDPAGRVHGIEGLRVIDASIMPTIPRGNTNIPTIMVAEKLSDEVLRSYLGYLGKLT